MNRNILRLALPNILSNISVPLLSTVDVVLMGHLSVLHLGAIGLGTMIFNFFFWNFGFLRMGTTGMVAQAFGAQDLDQTQNLLSQGIYTALLIAFLIILLQMPIGSLAHILLNIGNEHSDLVWTYFSIRIWAAPATLVTYCLFGWLFGMQNAFFPMAVTIVINLINISLSYYMVSFMNWGIAGVAYGTVLAEYIGVAILVMMICHKYKVEVVAPSRLRGWMQYITLNKNLFIRTIALTTAFGFFYRESTLAGGVVLATNVVLLQFLSWMSYGIDGFAYASESLVGRYFGGGRSESLLKVIRYSFIWGLALALLFSLLYGLYGREIGSLFTNDEKILKLISEYRVWLLLLPVLAFPCYIWDGVFIGLMRSKLMRDSMLLSLVLYVLIYLVLNGHFKNAIWISFALFLSFRGIILSLYWSKERHRVITV